MIRPWLQRVNQRVRKSPETRRDKVKNLYNDGEKRVRHAHLAMRTGLEPLGPHPFMLPFIIEMMSDQIENDVRSYSRLRNCEDSFSGPTKPVRVPEPEPYSLAEDRKSQLQVLGKNTVHDTKAFIAS